MLFEDILYPRICITCKGALSKNRHHLCDWCEQYMFDFANPRFSESCEDIIMPENVAFQHAHWKYDKGGYLQEILHALKYKNLPKLGVDIGMALGSSLAAHPQLKSAQSVRLVPVPLHAKKKRLRGYNQALKIAEGIAQVTDFNIIPEQAVIRTRHTKTQTGFSLSQRQENMASAFKVILPYSLSKSHLVIVDDVFTTGATSFELANVLSKYTSSTVGIATVALA